MAEMVIGEKVTLEEMGGARMHATVSGCGDNLYSTEEEVIFAIRKYLSYLPQNFREYPPDHPPRPPEEKISISTLIPENQNQPFDMYTLIKAFVDEGSFFEIKPLWAKELICGFARLEGMVVGIVANQPKVKGGVLFVDSADKGARFIWLCSAFNIPIIFLADVPGFMIGTKVEREGIIRHGAKMIYAVSTATVPRISVIVRKAYGAGLYAMSGPGFLPDVTLAFPSAMIAVMGPEAAVNAVYYNKIQELPPEEREKFIQERREEYKEDINIYRLASDLVVDDIVHPDRLREVLVGYISRIRHRPRKRYPQWNGIPPA
jgi:acetyl-CoA carboxylase carboxyltransferase component